MAEVLQDHRQLLDDIRHTELEKGQGAYWWMGQHTFIVKAGGKVIYIDPWFAPWPSRQTPALLTPQETRYADFALITHGHSDHLCPETLPYMAEASPNAIFICPRPEQDRVVGECKIPKQRLHAMTDGDVFERAGVKITAIKSKHETFDEHPELGFPFLGYVVEAGGVIFYHSGDCILYDGLIARLKQWTRIDCLFLPINGRDAERFTSGCIGNFTYQEVVEIAGELNPGLVAPSHYDMFIGNQEDPQKFARYISARFPSIPFHLGPAGEKVLFPHQDGS